MKKVAAVTMVRDDLFFLRAWLRHYGEMLGRENCTIVNHGHGPEVAELAAGCNVIGIPGDPHKNFDMKRWGLLNGLLDGLRRYYDHVVVGDVDELVIVDPETGLNLPEFLDKTPTGRVLTPLGLEVIHRIDLEMEPITDRILGPRRHVRPAPHYSKPCIVSAPARLSRGGHYAQYGELHAPEPLYLLHLKYCDFGTFTQVMNQRNAMTAQVKADPKKAAIGRHWFAETRGEDRAIFEAFAELEMIDGFNMKPLRRRMHRTWAPRDERGVQGYYHFKRPDYSTQYVLPERFSGVI
ncbi:glycosyltransferase family 2 protein [Roseobacter sp. YSTF-M11]|uniref:Glycosyltransferase family 2 protein n=1 Tax=Roseobacter insulae TaxID=2859783 RepID=A0A9X1FW46_9RHOB|nr:glycosyltransferase family 2 protein [Roseobacter insulae]MBW4708686.1 glycosyltransferase family 2 protein [Roseobacter insulae]